MIIGLTNIYDFNMGPAQIIIHGEKDIVLPITLLQTENITNGLNNAEIEDSLTGLLNDLPVSVRFKSHTYNNVMVELYGQQKVKHNISFNDKINEYIESPTEEELIDIIKDIKNISIDKLEETLDIIEESNNKELINMATIAVEESLNELLNMTTPIVDTVVDTVVDTLIEPIKKKKEVKAKKEKTIKEPKVENIIYVNDSTENTIIYDIPSISYLESTIDRVENNIQNLEDISTTPIIEELDIKEVNIEVNTDVKLEETIKSKKVKKTKLDITEIVEKTDIYTDRHNDDLYNEKI